MAESQGRRGGSWAAVTTYDDDQPSDHQTRTLRDSFRLLEWLSTALVFLGALIAIAGVAETIEFWRLVRQPSEGILTSGGGGDGASNLRLIRDVLGSLAFGAVIAGFGYVIDLLLTIGTDVRDLVESDGDTRPDLDL